MSTCPRCHTATVYIPAAAGQDVTVCGCWRAYARQDFGRPQSTAYCVSLECGCRPAGRSAAYGALTGRARWWLTRYPGEAYGSDVTLCGGCYRKVRHVVSRGEPEGKC